MPAASMPCMAKSTSNTVKSTPPSVIEVAHSSTLRVARIAVAVAVAGLAAIGTGCGAGSSGEATEQQAEGGAPAADAGDASAADAAAVVHEALCTLTGAPASAPGEVLVFADEFAGTTVDTTKWNVADGDKRQGTILNTSSPDAVKVRDGSLFVSADRSPAGATKPYVAGFLDALGSYARTYGKFEFRARFPRAEGVWYAIWATPWSQPFPEVDIEITNIDKTPQLWLVNHWAAPPLPANSRRTYFVAPKDVKKPTDAIALEEFHTYTMIWKPGLLELRLDGETKMQRTAEGVPDLPLAWKINSWVGGWGGTPTATSTFPVTFEVDYVRVYRLDGLIAAPSVRIMNRKAEYNRTEVVQIALADFDEACAHVEMYDGATRITTKSNGPLRFPLSSLKAGQHKLSFVATDGARSTVASVDALVK